MTRTLAVLAIVLVPRLALADWYYKWWCTGQCAPHDLATHGTVGPFQSKDSCDSARGNDWHKGQATQSGNLANIDDCFESDHEDTDSSSSSPPEKVVAAGITRFYGGVAVGGVSSFAYVHGSGGGLGGIELARGWTPGKHFYFFGDLGYAQVDLRTSTGTIDTMHQFVLAYGGEYMIGSGKVTGFIHLGAGLVIAGFAGSTDWLGLDGGAGLDLSLSDRVGLLVFGSGLATYSNPGGMYAGLAIELRSPRLVAIRRGKL